MDLATKNFGLFIGVEDYRTWDPSGKRDLPGGRADARAFYKICLDLGIPAENLRICTSPRLDPAELIPPGCCHDATHESIGEAIKWVARHLVAGRAGLLTYSGHADWSEKEGVLLCPSDVSVDPKSGKKSKQVSFARIERNLKHAGVNRLGITSLTVVLDTCYAGRDMEDILELGLNGLAGEERKRAADTVKKKLAGLGDRVLGACGPKETARRARFSGAFRGAFSWAVASALEHWNHEVVDGRLELDLSCGELLESFTQTPELLQRGEHASSARFFQAGSSDAKKKTSREPTARRPGGQLDPEHNYSIELSSVTAQKWEVCVTGGTLPPASGYAENTEYWALDAAFAGAVGTARDGDTLRFQETTYEKLTGSLSFTTPTKPDWTQMPPAEPPRGPMFWREDTGGNHVGLSFGLTAGTPWTGRITWYAALTSDSAAAHASVVSDTTIFTWGSSTPALPSNSTLRWYEYTAMVSG